jgi:hypothetical protein
MTGDSSSRDELGTGDLQTHTSHGEMKREIAWRVETEPDRYGSETGNERHKRLTADEIRRIADELGLGWMDETRQQMIDSIMLKLGRDYRTGVRSLDFSDLRAILRRLTDAE